MRCYPLILTSAGLAATLFGCVGDQTVGAVDSGAPSPATPGNVKENAGFESGCAAWNQNAATLTPSVVPHGGKGACLVCAKQNGGVYSILGRVPTTGLTDGTKYQATAWLRKPDDKSLIPSRELAINLFIDRGENAPDGDKDVAGNQESPTAPLTDEYQKAVSVTVPYVKGPDARSIGVEIIDRESGSAACFLIDDFEIAPVTP